MSKLEYCKGPDNIVADALSRISYDVDVGQEELVPHTNMVNQQELDRILDEPSMFRQAQEADKSLMLWV